MENVRIGVVGGGLVAQVVHLPTLRSTPGVDLVGLAEPSPALRDRLASRFGIAATYPTWERLLDEGGLDGVVVCAPNALHLPIVASAIERGIGAFVEKPLCLGAGDADRLAVAAATQGTVLQVGYMKRFDAGYAALLEDLAGGSSHLRHVNATTYDPGLARFFGPEEFTTASDLAVDAREALREAEVQQVGRALGVVPTEAERRTFVDVYLGALIHDVNVVHGVTAALGLGTSRATSSAAWNDGHAATGTAELTDGTSWTSTWMMTPGVDTFTEEITFYFDDCTRRLTFEPPYGSIKRRGTRYAVRDRSGTTQREFRDTSFASELAEFVRAVRAREEPAQDTVASGIEDIRLLGSMFALTLT